MSFVLRARPNSKSPASGARSHVGTARSDAEPSRVSGGARLQHRSTGRRGGRARAREQIDLALDSTVTHTTHRFATLADLKREIVDARVWAGLHLRGSGEDGVRLGERVARWALQRYFRPTRPRPDDD